jgi:hypothetical protein
MSKQNESFTLMPDSILKELAGTFHINGSGFAEWSYIEGTDVHDVMSLEAARAWTGIVKRFGNLTVTEE